MNVVILEKLLLSECYFLYQIVKFYKTKLTEREP